MKKHLFLALLLFATFGSFSQVPYLLTCPTINPLNESVANGCRNAKPVAFVENKGQWQSEVLFCAQLNGTNVWITRDGIVYDFYKTERIADTENSTPPFLKERLENSCKTQVTGHVVKMNFAGRKSQATMTGINKQEACYNYFLGNDSSKWAGNVALFDEVFIRNRYDNIDARLYFDEGRLRYDLIAAPYANLRQIKFDFEGQENIWVNDNGELTLKTCLGNVEQNQLYAYQEINGQKKQVACKFSLPNLLASFEIGNYNPSHSIIIDPLVYSTFLGGSGDDGLEPLIKVDGSGFVYVSGETLSVNFPVTIGAYQTTNSSRKVFVTKFNPELSGLIYSTFIGGTSTYEYPDDLDLDQNGNVYITGVTKATNFPVTPGVFQPYNSGGSYEGFVTKLNSTGSALIFSTYIGGSAGSGSDWGMSIAVDNVGAIFLTGVTTSSNFPVTSGAFIKIKPNNWVQGIAYVSKINSNGSALIYSTFLGGTGDSDGYSIAIDNVGNAYISGGALNNFPTTTGAFDQTSNGGWDAYISILNPTGSALIYSTYLGGSLDDRSYMNNLAIDNAGKIYLGGITKSTNFPTTSGAYQSTNHGGNDMFVLKLNPASTGASDLIYSTYLGGSSDDGFGLSIDLDANGNISCPGYTSSTNFPVTPGCYQPTNAGGWDASFTRINATGTGLLYSTYLGGLASEYVPSVVVTGTFAYLAGVTNSAGFPTTAGAFDQTYNGGSSGAGYGDVFVTKLDMRSIIAGNIPVDSICAGIAVSVPYIASDSFDVANVFIAQLSNAAGSFTTPIDIGSVTGVISGVISAVIPSNTPAGSGYRIRVVSSSPVVTGTNNGTDIAVIQCPATTSVTGTITGIVCYDATQTVMVAGAGTSLSVLSNGSVTIIAGQKILFLPNTSVQAGGYLWGYIAPAGPFCTTQAMPSVTTNLEELSIENPSFKIYPNPTVGSFFIEINGEGASDQTTMNVYGVLGEQVLSVKLHGTGKKEFTLAGRPAGIYFVRITTGNKTATTAIIKQ